jgi:hypothetical protein
MQLPIPKTQLNSVPLLPSSCPSRLGSRNSTLQSLLLSWIILYNHFAWTSGKHRILLSRFVSGTFTAPLHSNGPHRKQPLYSRNRLLGFCAVYFLVRNDVSEERIASIIRAGESQWEYMSRCLYCWGVFTAGTRLQKSLLSNGYTRHNIKARSLIRDTDFQFWSRNITNGYEICFPVSK